MAWALLLAGLVMPLPEEAAEVGAGDRSCGDEQCRALEARHRKLESAMRARAGLLARMSHELRTPLNAVMGFADLLLDPSGGVGASQREYAEEIKNAGKHLLAIINGVLDLAKLEAGAMKLELDELEPELPVHQAVQMIRPLAAKNHVAVDVAVAAQAKCVADYQRLKQVVVNLLSNAVKFTPAGGRIDVRIREVEGHVEIAVSDTGIGIDPALHARVFEEYAQVITPDGKHVEGTGLGLALVKGFVTEMGGSVSVQSKLGEGATFTIRLPQRRAAGAKATARVRLALTRAASGSAS